MTFKNEFNFGNTALPIIDPQNPFYCPSISASAYLNSIFHSHKYSKINGNTTKVMGNDYGIKKRFQMKGFKRGQETKKAISSFAKMLAQVVLHSDDNRLAVKNTKGTDKKNETRSGRAKELLVSTSYCIDYGTPSPPADLRIFQNTQIPRSTNCKAVPPSSRTPSLKSSPRTVVFSGPRLRAGARPVRKTRKDRAAKMALLETNLKIHDLSPLAIPELSALPDIPLNPTCTPEEDSQMDFTMPQHCTGQTAAIAPMFPVSGNDVLVRLREQSSPHIHSISISLPELPIWDISAIAAGSPFRSQSISEESDTIDRLSPTVPRRPPGLSPNLVINDELRADRGLLKTPSHGAQHEETSRKPFKVNRKRRLSEAFPDLLRKPVKFARSLGGYSVPIDDHVFRRELSESSTLLQSPELELDDLKAIVRGRELVHTPATGRMLRFYGEDAVHLEDNRERELEELLCGPSIGTETPRGYSRLAERLDCMIPGIQLGERLTRLGVKPEGRHQSAVDFLASEGLLNEQVMDLFRTSEITRLSLSLSLAEEDGLNLGGCGVWDVFTRVNSFLFLTSLSFNNIPIKDFNLTKLGRLPRLSVLNLDNTGIADEGVFHLVALKHTLTHLSLNCNPCITDDAVPALILLEKLRYLGLVQTSVGMVGLRKLARVIERDGRLVDVEIPEVCERYVDGLSTAYLLHPLPPLITAPSLCSRLSMAALKRNLEAHKEVNSNIVAGGTREEMCERLKELLVRREVDLVVWGMIYGEDGQGEAM